LRVVEHISHEGADPRLAIAPLKRLLHRLHHPRLNVGQDRLAGCGSATGQMPQQRDRWRFGEHQRSDELRMPDGQKESGKCAIRVPDDMNFAEA